ncbi:hypothetical protein W911_11115 [Hyphomicrobium nitrativorans NL23]|uniref:Uncharacterized protein n=1 Tax=Hyphomicrobium nitrativorans NL23 TaxID=1029756 RepID=V5SI42_9HYPH|nr:hypothetical protein W911_11115 [Hyphomicrobium nitrativorans NL23]
MAIRDAAKLDKTGPVAPDRFFLVRMKRERSLANEEPVC